MKTSIYRIAQADPGAAPPPAAPPPPPAGGDLGAPPPMDLGMGGMPPMPGGPAPTGGPATTTPSGNLLFPLENLGMILKDAEIEKKLSEILSSSDNINTTSEEEIANVIFQMYGGNKLGGVDEWKKGERLPNKEVEDKEIQSTSDSRWKRLPAGKTLNTLEIPVTLSDVEKAIKAISFGISKAKSKEAPAGGGAMASVNLKKMIRISGLLDNLGFYSLADNIIPK